MRGIVREMNYWDKVGAPGESVSQRSGRTTVRCRMLESKASEYGINDLAPFYASTAFASARFTHDPERGMIYHEPL